MSHLKIPINFTSNSHPKIVFNNRSFLKKKNGIYYLGPIEFFFFFFKSMFY